MDFLLRQQSVTLQTGLSVFKAGFVIAKGK